MLFLFNITWLCQFITQCSSFIGFLITFNFIEVNRRLCVFKSGNQPIKHSKFFQINLLIFKNINTFFLRNTLIIVISLIIWLFIFTHLHWALLFLWILILLFAITVNLWFVFIALLQLLTLLLGIRTWLHFYF
jgi:hypothetical protein